MLCVMVFISPLLIAGFYFTVIPAGFYFTVIPLLIAGFNFTVIPLLIAVPHQGAGHVYHRQTE